MVVRLETRRRPRHDLGQRGRGGEQRRERLERGPDDPRRAPCGNLRQVPEELDRVAVALVVSQQDRRAREALPLPAAARQTGGPQRVEERDALAPRVGPPPLFEPAEPERGHRVAHVDQVVFRRDLDPALERGEGRLEVAARRQGLPHRAPRAGAHHVPVMVRARDVAGRGQRAFRVAGPRERLGVVDAELRVRRLRVAGASRHRDRLVHASREP
jgi:hypothetical protein